MRWSAYVISMFFVYLYFFTIYLSYLFIFSSSDTIFDWLTPLSAMFFSTWRGPHTNHHNVYMFCSLSFLGELLVNKYVYSFRLGFF